MEQSSKGKEMFFKYFEKAKSSPSLLLFPCFESFLGKTSEPSNNSKGTARALEFLIIVYSPKVKSCWENYCELTFITCD